MYNVFLYCSDLVGVADCTCFFFLLLLSIQLTIGTLFPLFIFAFHPLFVFPSSFSEKKILTVVGISIRSATMIARAFCGITSAYHYMEWRGVVAVGATELCNFYFVVVCGGRRGRGMGGWEGCGWV